MVQLGYRHFPPRAPFYHLATLEMVQGREKSPYTKYWPWKERTNSSPQVWCGAPEVVWNKLISVVRVLVTCECLMNLSENFAEMWVGLFLSLWFWKQNLCNRGEKTTYMYQERTWVSWAQRTVLDGNNGPHFLHLKYNSWTGVSCLECLFRSRCLLAVSPWDHGGKGLPNLNPLWPVFVCFEPDLCGLRTLRMFSSLLGFPD